MYTVLTFFLTMLTVAAITATVSCWWRRGGPKGTRQIAFCVAAHFGSLGLVVVTSLMWLQGGYW